MTKQMTTTPRGQKAKAAPTPIATLPEGVESATHADGTVGVVLTDGPKNHFADMGGSKVPHFNSLVFREVLGTAWIPGDACDRQDNLDRVIASTAAALIAFKPTNEIEGMMAAQAVALHFGAMECFRRSMIPNQPGDAATRLRRDGANLSRAMVELVDALDRRRGKGRKQVVRVERVVVQGGGQAIVGNVTPAGRCDPGEGT